MIREYLLIRKTRTLLGEFLAPMIGACPSNRCGGRGSQGRILIIDSAEEL
jgi:hypothetical protein